MSVDLSFSPETPALPPGPAIVVSVAARSEHGIFRKIVVHGAFQIDAIEGERLGVMPLHAAVVIVATAGQFHQATQLLGETFGFADDEDHAGTGLVRGAFRFDLLERFRPPAATPVHVTAVLGPLLSNTVTVRP